MGYSMVAAGAGLWVGLAVILVLVAVGAWIAFRMTYAEHMPALRQVPLFRRLTDGQVRSIARQARRIGFAPGSRIVQAGEAGKGFFLIQEGTVAVLVGEEEKSRLGPGGHFGEIAALDGGPRSSTVVASSSVTALEVPSSKFLALLDSDSSIGLGVYEELADRLPADQRGRHESAGRVTRKELADLCSRLRDAESPDWGGAS